MSPGQDPGYSPKFERHLQAFGRKCHLAGERGTKGGVQSRNYMEKNNSAHQMTGIGFA